jgi:hypothetical protein
MVTVITDERQIKDHHKTFHNRLKQFLTEKIHCWVGYPSGSFQDTVLYSPDLNIWMSLQEHHNKTWNGFGIGKPIEGRNNSLNGEINFPYKGIYRRVSGAFAREDNGNILVLHRGRIGGGKPGIGKNYFISNFRGDFVNAIDGDKETEFCLVGELNSNHFPNQVANFISEIYRVKQREKGDAVEAFDKLTDFSYTDEGFGQTVTERNDTIIIERTHGIIVKALAQELQNRGLNIANDRNRDLFIHSKGKIITLFEVKTSSSTQNLYSAVGQLIIYSIPIGNEVNLIAILPNKLSKAVEKRLSTLGIKPIYYEWHNDEPKFLRLNDIL